MTCCPHDNRPCGAPRCAVCPLLPLGEDDALAALFAVAAMLPGHVNQLWLFAPSETIPVGIDYAAVPMNFGYAALPTTAEGVRSDLAVWTWDRARGLYGLMALHEISPNIFPGGRVDRGLGAIRP